VCSVGSTSLTDTWRVESYHSNSLSHVYPNWLVTWVDVGGGCYKVVSDHGSPLGLDGQCVGHAFMSVAYVLFLQVIYFLISYAWC